MRKIPTIFMRDWQGDRSRVLDVPIPECQWVFDGEGTATRKYDGVACMFDGSTWFKRRTLHTDEAEPPGFVEAQNDEVTGQVIGWVPIGDGPTDKHMRTAITNTLPEHKRLGTFEYVGPKSQGGVETAFTEPVMYRHDHAERYFDVDRTFDGIREFLSTRNIEGIVFHHPDGRMAKIKKRDFGLKRRPE